MRIGHHDLDRRVMIVAEIGNNHEGDIELAERLVGLAAEAGVDAVKFQTYRTELFEAPSDRARFERLRRFELAPRQFERLAEAARRAGLAFISTPLDLPSAAVLEPLVDAYKIASADNTFVPLLDTVATTHRPVLISTGLATFTEVAHACAIVQRHRRARGRDRDLALLHCVSAYPVPPDEVNLAAIATLRQAFGCPIGYSDHTLGTGAPVLAVGAGARIIEKHFTIDKRFSGFRDHALSADPAEMAELVCRVRQAERVLGDGALSPRPCERDSIADLRRSAVAARDLAPGSVLGPAEIRWVRPGGGIAPAEASRLLGRSVALPIDAGMMLTEAVLEPQGDVEPVGAS